jgi:hypothetical protein
MTRITINGNEYSIGKLSAFDQFHVARRLAPVIAVLFEDNEVQALARAGLDKKAEATAGAGEQKTPLDADFALLAKALAVLNDQDVEFIFNKCLEAVERKQATGFTRVRVNGVTMFELELQELLQLCWHVARENLGNFTDALPSVSDLVERLNIRASNG